MSRPDQIDPNKLIGYRFPSKQFTFTQNQAILYALSIGFSSDPLKISDFKYTYQKDDSFIPFPTLSTTLGKINIQQQLQECTQLPKSFNALKILHAFQRTQMLTEALKPNFPYVVESQVVDIQDKGKMSLIVISVKLYEKQGNLLSVENTVGIMMMGVGGFGFKGKNLVKIPSKTLQRTCDLTLKDKSFSNQAFFYRLNGDDNPLHIDPNVSSLLGFNVPIIHGLCTMGIVARSIVQNCLSDDPTQMKAFNCRFVGHVFPGESYEIKVWKQKNQLQFVANVSQRNKPCLVGSVQLSQKAKL